MDGDIAVAVLDGIERPNFGAHKTVRGSAGIIRFGAKPRKANRNTAANGLAFGPLSAGTQKNYFFRAGGLPGSYLRAVQMDCAGRFRCGDADDGKAAKIGHDVREARDSEAAMKF